jgi:hypothetical protein
VKRTAAMIAIALLVAGCGSGSRNSSPITEQSPPNVTTTVAHASTTSAEPVSTALNTPQLLREGVRAALLANHRLSIRVLWTNQVPSAAANSIRGPALVGLRTSARDRQSKGVRVRMVRDQYRILSISLGRSFRAATAVAESIQIVLPSYLNGRPRGRSVHLDERARILLRRIGTSHAFVIWRVALLK